MTREYTCKEAFDDWLNIAPAYLLHQANPYDIRDGKWGGMGPRTWIMASELDDRLPEGNVYEFVVHLGWSLLGVYFSNKEQKWYFPEPRDYDGIKLYCRRVCISEAGDFERVMLPSIGRLRQIGKTTTVDAYLNHRLDDATSNSE